MKEIHIITAILTGIQEFQMDEFSIFDITQKIREKVNNDEIIIEDYGDYVSHEDVKRYFLQLRDNGLMKLYKEDYNPDGYRVYKVDLKSLTDAVMDELDDEEDEDDDSTSTPVAYTKTTIDKDVQMEMFNYINKYKGVTIKQIQSRFKKNPYTCQEIYDFLSSKGIVSNSANEPVSKIKVY